MLLNDEFGIKQAGLFAERVREAAPDDVGRQIEVAYQSALGRNPETHERELASEYLKTHNLAGFTHVLLNLNEFVYLR